MAINLINSISALLSGTSNTSATKTANETKTATATANLVAAASTSDSLSISGTLQKGSTGQEVMDLQNALKKLGYFTSTVDGDFGDLTKSAVIKFQAAKGLTQDGIVGAETKAAISDALTAASALKLGSSGEAVKELQVNLTKLGFDTKGTDGVFGQNTYNAVVAFQNSRGLTADGIVGLNTKNAIDTAISALNNPSLALKIGSSGDEVIQLQVNLTRLGYDTNGADGVFGQNTYDAVVAFQTAKGLTADGIVGAATKNAITEALKNVGTSNNNTSSSQQIALKKALAITSSFEGSGFVNVTGNFDGQGISVGALQWNIGQGSLQPLLRRMDTENNALTRQIFGSNYDSFHNMLSKSQSEQLAWAKSINNSSNKIVEPWNSQIKALCGTVQFQQIQMDAVKPVADRALAICQKYNLKSERAFALAFDIATQNGSVSSTADSIIKSKVTASTTEKEKLVIIATAVADCSKAIYRNDVYSRKMTIVNGSGTVHGSYVNVDVKYGLSDAAFR